MSVKTTNIWTQKTDNTKDPVNRETEKIKKTIDFDLKRIKEEKEDNYYSRYNKNSVKYKFITKKVTKSREYKGKCFSYFTKGFKLDEGK